MRFLVDTFWVVTTMGFVFFCNILLACLEIIAFGQQSTHMMCLIKEILRSCQRKLLLNFNYRSVSALK